METKQISQKIGRIATKEVIESVANGECNRRYGGSDKLEVGLTFVPTKLDVRKSYLVNDNFVNESDLKNYSEDEVREVKRIVFVAENADVSVKYFCQDNTKCEHWDGEAKTNKKSKVEGNVWVPKTRNLETFILEHASSLIGKTIRVARTGTSSTQGGFERKHVEFEIL